jgi:hypothetical protein
VLDRDFSMGLVSRSLVISVATFTYLLATPLAGFLSDRMPRQKLVRGDSFFVCSKIKVCAERVGVVVSQQLVDSSKMQTSIFVLLGIFMSFSSQFFLSDHMPRQTLVRDDFFKGLHSICVVP